MNGPKEEKTGGVEGVTLEDGVSDVVVEDEETFIKTVLSQDEEYQEMVRDAKAGGNGHDTDLPPVRGNDDDKSGTGDDEDDPNDPDDDPDGEGDDDDNEEVNDDLAEIDDKAELRRIMIEEGLDFDYRKSMTADDLRAEMRKARDEQEETVEFEDDVIPGLKGEDLKGMGRRARTAVVDFYGGYEDLKKERDTLKGMVDSLEDDPIIKHRKEMIESGQGGSLYPVDQVSATEVRAILNSDTEGGAAKIIQNLVERRAQNLGANLEIRYKHQRETEQANQNGMAVLLEAANIHPDHQVKEKDVSKITAGHGDWQAWNAVGRKIQKFCSDRGWKYGDIATMKPKSLYAAVAAEEGWEFSVNSGRRDANMIARGRSSAINAFRKTDKETARTLRSRGSDRRQRGGRYEDGIDVVKLASDDSYHEELLFRAGGDERQIDRLSRLRERGESIIRRKRGRDGD